MKMNFRSMALAALALAVAFSSCSKTEGEGDGQDRNIYVQLKNSGTRASGSHVADGKDVVFNDGYLVFTNAAGSITKVVKIVKTAPAAGEVAVADLEAGKIIDNVPGTSSAAYLAGNIPASLNPATVIVNNANIDVVNKMVLTVTSQQSAGDTKEVDNVSLYGFGSIVAVTGAAHGADYEARFDVTAVSSRFEISKISAKTTSHITGFKVAGVFVNRYWANMNLDNTKPTSETVVYAGSDPADYVPGASSTYYPNSLSGIVYDYSVTGIGNYSSSAPWICTPTSADNVDKVWGYNLLPPTGEAMISIVIRLTGVTTDLPNDPYAGKDWFLTIDTFKNGATPVTSLVKGSVYRITDVTFDENDLGVNPHEKFKEVFVDINLVQWKAYDLNYEFN